MKILSVNVKAFGKLSNVNLNFNDGINVISNVNGFGKTTMASFIRAMLYGFTYSRLRGSTDAAHYAPWGSDDKFGGSMTVEHNGETYRIERYFGKTARAEQLTVTNAKTNKQADISTSLGEYFLGLTADSYDRSAYFPQEAVELSTNDNFESKLANLVQNNDVDYDKVQRDLRDYRRNLRLERGNGGEIYELTVKQRQFQRELNDAVLAERRNVEIDSRLKEIAVERKQLNAEQSACKKQLDEVNKRLAEQSLSQLDKENLARLTALEAKIARVPQEIAQDKQILDNLANEVSHVKDDVKSHSYAPNGGKVLWALMACALLLAVVGVVLIFTLPSPIGYIVGPILIVLGFVSGILIWRYFNRPVTLPSGEKDALISEYFKTASKYVVCANELDYNSLVRQFMQFYSDYLGDKRELETLRSIVKRTNGNVGELENQVEQIERQREIIANRLTSVASEEGRLTQEKKTLNFDSITPRERIDRLAEQIAAAERRYQVAGVVSELLAEAKEKLSSSYLPRLCDRCQTLLCRVTNRNYEVAIDRAFNVCLRENGQTKPMSEFSRGIREITLLCFRIALSELLYDGAIPFVIVDDAFVNFDEDNFVRATSLLKTIAERGQVIYFTCHKRTGNLLKNA